MHKTRAFGEQNVVLAIDAGGTCFKSALITCGGTLIASSFYQSAVCSSGTADVILATYEKVIRHGYDFAERSDFTIRKIGVSTPGPFDYNDGISLLKHKFASLYGVNLVNLLKDRLQAITNIPFHFRHDTNSFLAGELWQGAARGYSRVAGVTLGTGIGISCYSNGRFINNELGSPSPDVSIWNKPYREGIVEDYVSARALIADYQRVNPQYDPENGAKGIADAVKLGDKDAIKVYERFGAYLGEILGSWNKLFTPEIIVFGGQIARDFGLFSAPIRRQFSSVDNAPDLLVSRLGNNAALYGVAIE